MSTGSTGGGASTGGDANGGDGGVAVSEGEMYARVIEHTGVDRGKLERLVHLDDDGPRITITGIKLGKNNAERTRAVAQVLTIARGFGMDEAVTSLEGHRTGAEAGHGHLADVGRTSVRRASSRMMCVTCTLRVLLPHGRGTDRSRALSGSSA